VCNRTLEDLRGRCAAFAAQESATSSSRVDFWAEARYPQQNWEIDVPLTTDRFDPQSLEGFVSDFHARHQEIFAISDLASPVEIVSWHARVSCELHDTVVGRLVAREHNHDASARRDTYFAEYGHVQSRVVALEDLIPGAALVGPMIVESPLTTVVVDPGARVELLASGSLSIQPEDAGLHEPPSRAHAHLRGDGVSP